MTNYRQAVEKLNGRTRRKLENNTYLERRSDTTIAVKLHATDVVTYHLDGPTVLNSGGWKTVTTKDRINKYSPVRLFTERGVWYLGGPENGWKKTHVYQDGVRVDVDGQIFGAGEPVKNVTKEKRAISTYARKYVEALKAGKVEAPGPGDCFYCALKEVKTGRPVGECFQDHGHVQSHIEEGYFVPSLAFNALETFGGSMAARQTLWDYTHGNREANGFAEIGLQQIQKMIRRYVSRQLGYQA